MKQSAGQMMRQHSVSQNTHIFEEKFCMNGILFSLNSGVNFCLPIVPIVSSGVNWVCFTCSSKVPGMKILFMESEMSSFCSSFLFGQRSGEYFNNNQGD